jgi:putative transposase
LNEWFGTCRFLYNKSVHYINETPEDPERFNFRSIRKKFVSKTHRNNKNKTKNENLNGIEWTLETPQKVRAGTLRTLESNYKSAFSNLKNKNISKFKMGFKSKKNLSDCLTIEKKAISFDEEFKIYPTYFNNQKFKLGKRKNKKLKELKIEHDCKLIKQCGKYYILVPVKIDKKENKCENTVSLDPGSRTFLSGYSPNGHTLELHRDKTVLLKYFKRLDTLRSLRTKKKIQSKKLYKQERKIKNFKDDIHWKSINYLIKNYSTIFIGKLESQKCSMKMSNSKVNRNLLTLSHFTFRQRLVYKCNQNGVKICVKPEEFTSKTCTNCGVINEKLGSSKVFHCNSCNLDIDRDINGARNIYLKSITC